MTNLRLPLGTDHLKVPASQMLVFSKRHCKRIISPETPRSLFSMTTFTSTIPGAPIEVSVADPGWRRVLHGDQNDRQPKFVRNNQCLEVTRRRKQWCQATPALVATTKMASSI
jgi:hypothetical protein